MGKRRCNDVDGFVGARIKARRMELKESQTDLADALGVTFQQVQKYEKGTNRVAASMMWKIAAHLKVSPAFFFEGLDGAEQQQGGVSTRDALSFLGQSDGAKLIPALMRMPKPIAHQLIRLTQMIAEKGR